MKRCAKSDVTTVELFSGCAVKFDMKLQEVFAV